MYGHPVVRCDGIDDDLQDAFTTGGAMNQPGTTFAVAAHDAATVDDDTSNVLLDGDDGVNRQLVVKNAAAGVADDWRVNAGISVLGGDADSNWNIWTILFNGATSQFWLNGVSEGGPGASGVQAIDGLTVFSRNDGANNWDGDLVEIILYDANLSDADKNQVGAYLATRYGLSYTDI